MTQEIKKKFGSIKRYCELKGWKHKVFSTQKYLGFPTPQGQIMLKTLYEDGIIEEKTYKSYKKE